MIKADEKKERARFMESTHTKLVFYNINTIIHHFVGEGS